MCVFDVPSIIQFAYNNSVVEGSKYKQIVKLGTNLLQINSELRPIHHITLTELFLFSR